MVQMRWMAVAVLVVGLLAGPAAADTWDNTSGDYLWNTATNWADDSVPTATDDVTCDVVGGSTAFTPILINAAATANNFVLCYGTSGQKAYLDINANFTLAGNWTRVGGKTEAIVTHNSGTVSVGGAFSLNPNYGSPNTRYTMPTTSTGVLNVTGNLNLSRNDTGGDHRFVQQAGTVTVGGNIMNTSGSSTYTGYAAYELSGGSLTVTGSGEFGWKAAGWTDFTQSGGTASFGSLDIGAPSNDPGYGRAILSDAAQTSVTGNMEIGEDLVTGGTGVVKLDGSKTGAGTDVAVGGNLTANVQSTLQAVIDQAAINTATDMRKIIVTGNVTFDSGSLLDVAFDGAATPVVGTWTLMTWGGVLADSGLALDAAAAAAGWTFSTAGSQLTVTYVPEPATLALLGLGGLGLLLRRKRS